MEIDENSSPNFEEETPALICVNPHCCGYSQRLLGLFLIKYTPLKPYIGVRVKKGDMLPLLKELLKYSSFWRFLIL